ncbi:MAG: hypothetical protein LBH19_08030 [Dysgonamonadaceae bacterium]|jgi:hypothetical protein|nr:hypothetical protein [Dysgonamonadaceae bacterium]
MKNFIILTLCVLSLYTAETKAQYIPEKGKGRTSAPSGNEAKSFEAKSSIEDALKSNLFIIRQSYRLKDIASKRTNIVDKIFKKEEVYGKDGKSDFGTVYTFGVKTAGGFYSNAKIALPWLYDFNFEEYKRKTQYEPIISETKYKGWKDGEYKKLEYVPKQAVMDADSLVFVNSNVFNKIGLKLDAANGKKKGWIVWILNEEEKSDAFSFEIVSAERNLDSKNGSSEITAVSVSGKTVEGGLFVTERTTEVGQIALDISGLIFTKDNRWYIKKPVSEGQGSSKKENVTPNKDGLTPVK